MTDLSVQNPAADRRVSGEFVDFDGERYYAIRNVDRMPPFFISLISDDDHWLFASTTGGLTAGRVSPETALFPYITVDNIHDSVHHTGPKTIIRVVSESDARYWEPFNREHDALYATTRNIYKSTLGNKLCFEEINHDLGLAFRYSWLTSDEYGFVRRVELENLGNDDADLELVDGMQNILPAGTPRFTQTNSSNLVDAYKWTELDPDTGLACFSLYSGITDRAEPCESLKATTVFCLGLSGTYLVSADQLQAFREGGELSTEKHKRGIRGSYFVGASMRLARGDGVTWHLVSNIEQSQAEVVALKRGIKESDTLLDDIMASVQRGSDRLAKIMAGSDAFQATAEENVSAHHYQNVLFNVLRGGIFADQYHVPSRDFRTTIRSFNKAVYAANESFLRGLPERLRFSDLLKAVRDNGDKQLERLAQEYLPITFGRRHGDPSRPWNQFAINLKDEDGNELLSYQGNWRDIFQNWEALSLSYPEFVDNIIAKFVNASTMDGYNPYRITKEGIDWEVEEPDNPWSYIGYWGDHQIIYLLKLLELSSEFEPAKLQTLLREPIFCYANVPYLIKPFDKLLENPKSTVEFDEPLGELIEHRLTTIGADGKLVLTADEQVYQVNLLEKLLVPLLSKLGNLVIDGGIWMNTQRPEWNDANNALVGNGLSMVTLYYMRRYVRFMIDLLADETDDFELSNEVADWLAETASALKSLAAELSGHEGPASEDLRRRVLVELGESSSRFREAVYREHRFSGQRTQSVDVVRRMLDDALPIIDKSIATNRRDDGLYHAYNLLGQTPSGISVETLYPMLEGQVGILSSGALSAAQSVEVVEALFDSSIYRADQKSFMLYPDRDLPGFLEKNRIPAERIDTTPLLARMMERADHRIVVRDIEGNYRFNADFANVSDVKAELDELEEDYGADVARDRQEICDLYEDIFNHKAFTGRSGTMFGFEGLGSIYWHMVSKLLLAVMENYFAAVEGGADDNERLKLAKLYYRVREGIGFNKTPEEYGAFPTDPYSHTPKHAGASQPGMTGQVKEEMLSRFGELGVRVRDGVARFNPRLLRAREFVGQAREFRYLGVNDEWQSIDVPAGGLAFSWCQVPVLYVLDDNAAAAIVVRRRDGSEESAEDAVLTREQSKHLFYRDGEISQITVNVSSDIILS